jgi:hypothetical protein
MGNLFNGADLIHAYTRAQAIAEGVLVDVSATARARLTQACRTQPP